MKVLFAVNNDKVSEAIAKKYEREYKDILSYKNVYYFNAIIRELQKDKTYNRIVISEDLEPFANNNYDMIDKFLLEKYSNISREAKTVNEERIEVILLCADRRRKTEDIFVKIYNLEIYNAIIGQDRSIEEVCKLIYNPRDKNIAKQYYEIPISDLAGQDDSENNVSEAEVENILAHYKRLGKNEDKYVDSFNNIISQYTDTQLKIIIRYLPIHVKAVLEERSSKYQQLVTSGMPGQNTNFNEKANKYKQKTQKKGFWKSRNDDYDDEDDEDETIIDKEFTTPKITKPIVIPSDMNTENVQKINDSNIFRNNQTNKMVSEMQEPSTFQEQEKIDKEMQTKNIFREEQFMEQKEAQTPNIPETSSVGTQQTQNVAKSQTYSEPTSQIQSRPQPQQIEKPEIQVQNITIPDQIITPNVELQKEQNAQESVIQGLEELSQTPNKQTNTAVEQIGEDLFDELLNTETEKIEEQNVVEPVKKGRGRPRTKPIVEVDPNAPKRGRGRPRTKPIVEVNPDVPKRGRGRPRKTPIEEIKTIEPVQQVQPMQEETDLFSISEEIQPIRDTTVQEKKIELNNTLEQNQLEQNNNVQSNFETTTTQNSEIDLFSMEETEDKEEEQLVDLFDIGTESASSETDTNIIQQDSREISSDLITETNLEKDNSMQEQYAQQPISYEQKNQLPEDNYKQIENETDLFDSSNNDVNAVNLFEENNDITTTNRTSTYSNLNTLLTADKKIVAFVGTTKNGTSFVVNNTAEMLSSMGISTAILDMTKTKNSYYIYTNNEEQLRKISTECMKNLENGIAEGLRVSKSLTVYTEMPGEEETYNIDKVLSTLVQNYSAVLIDTDFDTPIEIFERVQEMYLVQSMDVLTIQPLTAFLRDLKSKNILKQEKIRIVINKAQRIRNLNVKTLIGGMSCYNAPNMSYMTELFDKDNVRYCEIPFETQNYVKYLESLAICSISLNGYTKALLTSLKELANMVYPLVGKQAYSPMNGRKDPFSKQTSNTLNKMKNKGY